MTLDPLRPLALIGAVLLTAFLALPSVAQPVRNVATSGRTAVRAPLRLSFPTDNEAVLFGDPARFYMGLTRHYGNEQEWAWEGGSYGYVRNARQTPAGWRFTRFHEGVDIAPLRRDSLGEPLDAVSAVDEGRVVDVNRLPGGSDYGRYVVLRHEWDGSPYFTRYAHLAEVDAVREGDRVRRGEPLGVLGYSGPGLDRARAHLHFEINLLINAHFETFRDVRHPSWRATRGIYHGSNLVGVDPVALLRRVREEPDLLVSDAITGQGEDLTVLVPAGPPPDMLSRYPWLCGTCASGTPPDWARAWEVGLTCAGLPVRIEPSDRRAETLQLLRVDPYVRADFLHSRLLTQSGPGADLSSAGRAHLALIFTRPGMVPMW